MNLSKGKIESESGWPLQKFHSSKVLIDGNQLNNIFLQLTKPVIMLGKPIQLQFYFRPFSPYRQIFSIIYKVNSWQYNHQTLSLSHYKKIEISTFSYMFLWTTQNGLVNYIDSKLFFLLLTNIYFLIYIDLTASIHTNLHSEGLTCKSVQSFFSWVRKCVGTRNYNLPLL